MHFDWVVLVISHLLILLMLLSALFCNWFPCMPFYWNSYMTAFGSWLWVCLSLFWFVFWFLIMTPDIGLWHWFWILPAPFCTFAHLISGFDFCLFFWPFYCYSFWTLLVHLNIWLWTHFWNKYNDFVFIASGSSPVCYSHPPNIMYIHLW